MKKKKKNFLDKSSLCYYRCAKNLNQTNTLSLVVQLRTSEIEIVGSWITPLQVEITTTINKSRVISDYNK